MKDMFSAERPKTFGDWLRIYRLYISAFPLAERKRFSIIIGNFRKSKSDVFVYRMDGKFSGFATTINDDRLILIDYLAVNRKMRGRGVGTYAMKTILQTYQDKGVFVEIESAYEEGRDQAERIRRKRFYETCGMKALGVAAMVFGVKMELLGARCEMDFETYHAFYRKNYSEWAAGHILKAEILSDQ